MRQMKRRGTRATGLGLVVSVALLLAGGTGLPSARAADCDAPEAHPHIAAAEAHLAAGRYRDAISEFNRAVLAAPGCDRAKQGVIEANRALLQRRAAGDSPGATIGRHISLGSAAFDAGDYDRAVTEWEAALALDPDNRVALALIASAHEAQVDQLIERGSRLFAAGDTAGAMAAWEQARELAPHNTTVRDLLTQGESQAWRETEEHLEDELDHTMRRIRTELEQARLLPHEDMTGSGLRLRDVSQRPPDVSLVESEARAAILEELRNPVSLDFEDTDLRAVIRFISEVTGINILIDEDIFEQLGEVDPDDEEGVKQIKVTIFVNELPLESALKGMLRQHQLDFQIQRDFLFVSTPDILRSSSFEQLEIRYYRLRDTARISLPKLSATQLEFDVEVGENVDSASAIGGELIQRLRNIGQDEVRDAPEAPINFSISRLLSLIRNFVPEVVETQTGATRQQAANRTEDTLVGGWQRIRDSSTVIEADHVVRERKWDAAGREILSRIEYEPNTHTLIAKNTQSNLELIEEMLRHLDQPTRQVVIESRFLSVDMTDVQRVNTDLSLLNIAGSATANSGLVASLGAAGTALGVSPAAMNFGGLFVNAINFGSTTNGKAFRARYSGEDGEVIQAAVELLTQLDNTEIVSAPRVTTLSTKPAVIQDIRTQTFLTDVDVTINIIQPPPGSSAAPTVVPDFDFSFTAVATGVTLNVTPLILDDDTIRLVLLPDVSNLGPGSTFDVPFVTFDPAGNSVTQTITITLIEVLRQTLYTNVTVSDGDTLVLGGLVNNQAQFQERSVPFLRSLPLIGNFFRSTGEFISRSQLLIFIKCNIISPEGISYVRLK